MIRLYKELNIEFLCRIIQQKDVLSLPLSKEKREKIAAKREREIQEAAIQLFDEKGYMNTTIADIAKVANISNGLIYHYFSSKKAILLSYGTLIQECEQFVLSQDTATDALRTFCKRVLMDYKHTGYHAPIRILITCFIQGELKGEDLGFPFNDYGKIFLGSIIKNGQKNGEFREGDPAIMGDILWHTVIGYTIHRINYGRDNVPLPEIDFFLEAIRK